MVQAGKKDKHYAVFGTKEDARRRFPRAELVKVFFAGSWWWTTKTVAKRIKATRSRE